MSSFETCAYLHLLHVQVPVLAKSRQTLFSNQSANVVHIRRAFQDLYLPLTRHYAFPAESSIPVHLGSREQADTETIWLNSRWDFSFDMEGEIEGKLLGEAH